MRIKHIRAARLHILRVEHRDNDATHGGVRMLLIGLRSTMASAMHQLKKALKARKRLLRVLLLTPVSWICASHIRICRGVT